MDEKATQWIKQRGLAAPRILDVGTGSGCMAITLKSLFPESSVVASDVSPEALDVAKINAKMHDCEGKIKFLLSDFFESFGAESEGYFDMIISNPPYVSESEMTALEPDLQFEPEMALLGGADGAERLKTIVQGSGRFLSENGVLMLEMGAKQKNKVTSFLMESGFQNIKNWKDLAGLDRICAGEMCGSI